MKRGLIFFTYPELAELANHLTRAQLEPYSLNKLRLPDEIMAELKIELTEEEGESLLDSLPMPRQTELSVLTNLRAKLQQFLQQLRHF